MTPRLFRGTVAAAALVFDEGVLGPAEAQRRVLACWTPGARLRRTQIGLTLTLPAPRRIAVNRCTRPAARRAGRRPRRLRYDARGGPRARCLRRRHRRRTGRTTRRRPRRRGRRPAGLDRARTGHRRRDARPVHAPPDRPGGARAQLGPCTRCSGRQSRHRPRSGKPSCATPAAARARAGLVPPGLGLFGWFRSLLRRKVRSAPGAGAPGRAADAEPSRLGARLRGALLQRQTLGRSATAARPSPRTVPGQRHGDAQRGRRARGPATRHPPRRR